jgi:mono/diheme cytochrome c family protein
MIMTRLQAVTLLLLIAAFSAAVLLWIRSTTTGKPVVINNTPVPPVPTPDPVRVAQGAVLYGQFCATCHGANLEGAPDWKKSLPDGSLPPPPHDRSGHTWHHPDSLLLDIVASGGDPAYNSKMPAFGDQITEDEMISILDFIKSKWGKGEREFQWWITVTQGNP